MMGILYVVATPIGNKEDITTRAKRILSEVDIIAAEDTRNTLNLLNLLNIKPQNKLLSYHKYNEKHEENYLIDLLKSGKTVALVTDAGTPCISDPGSLIVKSAALENIKIESICGPSAVIAALSISGFIGSVFAFYGFLPRRESEIVKLIKTIQATPIPIAVFYESPKRIISTLKIIEHIIPAAELCVCNDMTKLYEKVYRGNVSNVVSEISGYQYADKGEYTIVMSVPFHNEPASTNVEPSKEALLIDYIVKNNCSIKSAILALTERYKGVFSKNEFYEASLKIKQLLTK